MNVPSWSDPHHLPDPSPSTPDPMANGAPRDTERPRADGLDLYRIYLASRAAGLLGEGFPYVLEKLDIAELIAVNIGAESAKLRSWLDREQVERIIRGRIGVEATS